MQSVKTSIILQSKVHVWMLRQKSDNLSVILTCKSTTFNTSAALNESASQQVYIFLLGLLAILFRFIEISCHLRWEAKCQGIVVNL